MEDTPLRFDILHAQIEPKDGGGIFDSPLKRVNQPTEMSPFIVSEKIPEKISLKETLEIKSEVEEANNLESARVTYIEHLTNYLIKIRSKRIEFGKLMSSLNADRHMPLPEEKVELKNIKDSYLSFKKASLASIKNIEELLESEEKEKKLIFDSVISAFTTREKSILEKSKKIWNNQKWSIDDLSEAIISGEDLNSRKKVSLGTFSGFRAPHENKEITNAVENISPVNVKKPFDGVVKKKEVKSETIPELNSELKKEVDTILDIPEIKVNMEKVPLAEKLPVINGLKQEEKPEEKLGERIEPMIVPMEFNGKKMEIIKGGSSGDEIKIMFNSKEIAIGTMEKNGPVVLLNKKFKSGFLLAETEEEKAFKKAMDLIKTFKTGTTT